MIRYYFVRLLKKMRGAAILNSSIDKTSKIESGSQVINSIMGKHSFCGYDCKILNCKIGSFCSIADNVVIGGFEHPITWLSTSPVFYYGRDSISTKFSQYKLEGIRETKIGNDVWIGEGVRCKSGITIGNGAVIGMGSVLTKSVGDYEIWAGNPAKKIRERFSNDIKEELMNISWWNWPDEKIKKYSNYVKDPNQLIEILKKEGN